MFQRLQSKKNRESSQVVLALISIAVIVFVFALKFHNTIVCPFPKELRENNTIIFAEYFATGINPYSSSVLNSEIPFATSMYGFIVPLIMCPFVYVFSQIGVPSIEICEFVTICIELAGIIAAYKALKIRTEQTSLSLFGAAMLIGCYWRLSPNGGAFPDQWGLTGSILLMYLIIKDRANDKFNPIIYTILMITLTFTKQYFLFVIPGFLFFILLHDYKEFAVTTIILGILSAISCAVVYLVFPLFFCEAFPMASGQTLSWELSYSLKQIPAIAIMYPFICIAAIAGIGSVLKDVIKDKQLRDHIPYELCQMLLVFLPTVIIAKNQGTNYTYYLQLFFPYVLLFGIMTIHRIRLSEHYRNHIETLFVIIMIISFIPCGKFTYPKYYPQSDVQEWNRVYSMISSYGKDDKVLLPIALSDYCIKNNISTSEYGQAIYNNQTNLDHFHGNKIYRNLPLLKDTPALIEKNMSYNIQVRENVANGYYSIIGFDYMNEYDLTEDFLIDNGYTCIDRSNLRMENQHWDVALYVR